MPPMDEGTFGADAGETQRARTVVRMCECASGVLALRLWRASVERLGGLSSEPPSGASATTLETDGLPIWVDAGDAASEQERHGAGALLRGLSMVAWHRLAREQDGTTDRRMDRACVERAFALRGDDRDREAPLCERVANVVEAADSAARRVLDQRVFVEYLAWRYHLAECDRLARLDRPTVSDEARTARVTIAAANVLAAGQNIGTFVDGTCGLPQLDSVAVMRLHRWCVREALDDRLALAEEAPPTPAADTRRLFRWFAFRLASATFVARAADDVWNANSAATAEFVRGATAFPHLGLLLAGRRVNLSEANLSHLELQGANLSGATLSGAFLGGADLSGANLRGVFLSEASLSETILNGADLRGADLSEATMCRTWLMGALLHQADLSDAVLARAHLRDAELVEANLIRADLSGADLTRANLLLAQMGESVLNQANLTEARLVRANLVHACLFMAELVGADLYKANLENADLTNADLSNTDMRGVQLTTARLDRANLVGATLAGATLVRAKLRDTKLGGATLDGADLTWADLRSADLRGARFAGANLFGADLRDADLRDVDMAGANLHSVKYTSASDGAHAIQWPATAVDHTPSDRRGRV